MPLTGQALDKLGMTVWEGAGRPVWWDIRWGSDVLANWEHLETTWNAGRAGLAVPDLTLDGTRSLSLNADALANLIRAHLAKAVSAHEHG